MNKKIMILLVILLTVASVLLLRQWKSYTGGLEDSPKYKIEQAKQRINIETAEKELKITQTVTDLLKDKEYQIVKPDSLFRWQCIDSQGGNCKSFDNDSSTVIAETGELHFTFVIPIPEQPAFLLTDWTTVIQNVNIKETNIDIVEKERRGSTWVAGIPQTGFEKLSLIDYYSFKGKGGTPSLFWQPNSFEINALNKSITIYGNPLLVQNLDFQISASLERDEYLAVILTDSVKPTMGQGIKLVSPASPVEDVERDLINDYYVQKFTYLSNHEQWIIDFLTAITSETAPTFTKSEIMVAELSQNVSNEERNLFVQAVQKEKKLDFTILDQLLGDIKGLKTSFFSVNKDEESELISLLFLEPRKLIINDQITNINIVYRNDKILFPFVETLESMGFQVDTQEGTFYVTNPKDQFTFFLARPIFTRNGTDFGLLENPLHIENGQVYIEIESLQSIFHAVMIENQKSIHLNYSKKEK